jgi:hypothetical protein
VVSLLFVSENHNPEQLNRDFYNTEITSNKMEICTQSGVKFLL